MSGRAMIRRVGRVIPNGDGTIVAGWWMDHSTFDAGGQPICGESSMGGWTVPELAEISETLGEGPTLPLLDWPR